MLLLVEMQVFGGINAYNFCNMFEFLFGLYVLFFVFMNCLICDQLLYLLIKLELDLDTKKAVNIVTIPLD